MEQEKKTGKLKRWFKRNKDEIIATAMVFGLVTGAGVAGYKLSELQSAIGFKHLHESGIVKFFDPVTKLEVPTVEEACEVVKRTFNK